MEKEVQERFDRFDKAMEALRQRQDQFEVTLELHHQEAHVRLKKLEEMQIVLMDAQNSTWAAINALTVNITNLLRGRGSNGQGE